MLPQERRQDRERQRGSRGRRRTQREGRRAQGSPDSGDTQAQRRPLAASAAAWADGPQPVPIVEVGTRVRASDGQHGIVVDVQDTDGPLTYLVQLDGQSSGQLMPARMLKGAQI